MLCTSIYANNATTHSLTCQSEITHSSIAKALPNNQIQHPTIGWKEVSHFPDFSETHWKNYTGPVWYKIQWKYYCKNPNNNPLTLVISYMNMAAKIYLNNDLLWQDKSLNEPLSRSWNTPRYWNIPASSIKSGENTFWIYITNSGVQKASLGAVHIGTNVQVSPKYEEYLLKQRTLITIGFITNFTIGIFYFMVWLIYRKDISYLWISINTTLWLTYSGLFLINKTPISSTSFDQLLAWLFSTYTIVSCFSIWRFANRKFPLLEKFLLFLFIGISLVILFVPQQYLVNTLSFIFIINMIIFILQNITYPFIAYKTKQIEVYCLAFIRLCCIPLALHDAYQIITHQNEFWSPYITPINTLFLGIILGLKIYRSNNVIEGFNKTLTDKINAVTQELRTSLNAQHQLALANTRLQERMNLAHDLHDGLGGSLVRAIALVDRNDHLDKQNFLSILKLLRNDLRQVIDSGSSIGTKLPQTPILWASSIRRRFVQIFEELDIKSVWQLPSEWIHKPTPLECLTLTRVAEEALTNIIKHSHADCVQVRLIQDQKQLILEIEDNGVGFNPDTVQEGLHVGLQSMQVRINRIGGQFEILSDIGETIIRVKL